MCMSAHVYVLCVFRAARVSGEFFVCFCVKMVHAYRFHTGVFLGKEVLTQHIQPRPLKDSVTLDD